MATPGIMALSDLLFNGTKFKYQGQIEVFSMGRNFRHFLLKDGVMVTDSHCCYSFNGKVVIVKMPLIIMQQVLGNEMLHPTMHTCLLQLQ